METMTDEPDDVLEFGDTGQPRPRRRLRLFAAAGTGVAGVAVVVSVFALHGGHPVAHPAVHQQAVTVADAGTVMPSMQGYRLVQFARTATLAAAGMSQAGRVSQADTFYVTLGSCHHHH
jgi:hypothetical protein